MKELKNNVFLIEYFNSEKLLIQRKARRPKNGICSRFCNLGSILITNSIPLISLSMGMEEEIRIKIMYATGSKYFIFGNPDTLPPLRDIFYNMRPNDFG